MSAPDHRPPEAGAEIAAQAVFHHVELLARARRELGRCGADPEDVVQDAYVHLLRRTTDGSAPEHPRAWLHAVVRSLSAEERRKRAREQPSELAELASAAPGPEERVTMRAESRWLLGRIADLPDRERRAVVGMVSGLSHGLDGTRNAVYQALHRGRTRLRAAREGVWAALIPFRLFAARTAETMPPAGPPPSGRIAAALAAAAASIAAVGGVVVVEQPAGPKHGSAHSTPAPATLAIVPPPRAPAALPQAAPATGRSAASTRAPLRGARRTAVRAQRRAQAAAMAVPVVATPIGAAETSLAAAAPSPPFEAGASAAPQPQSAPAKVVDLEGPVVAVAAGALTIAVDVHGAQVPQTVQVPPGVDLGGLAPGQRAKLRVSVAADGTITLLARRDAPKPAAAAARVVDMDALVLAVAPGALTVGVDVHGARVPQTVHVPAGVELGGLAAGRKAKLRVSVAADGAITLIAVRDAGKPPRADAHPPPLPAPKIVDLDAPVLAVDAPSHGLVIAVELHGARIPQRVWVPAGIDLTGLVAGAKAKLKLAIGADGTTTLVALREPPKPPPATKIVDMDGSVVAVNPAAGALAMAVEIHGARVPQVMRVPAGFDLSGFVPGQTLKLKVAVAADGALTLVSRR